MWKHLSHLIHLSQDKPFCLKTFKSKNERSIRNETKRNVRLIPFGSERRRRGKQNKGAPKILLDFCSNWGYPSNWTFRGPEGAPEGPF